MSIADRIGQWSCAVSQTPRAIVRAVARTTLRHPVAVLSGFAVVGGITLGWRRWYSRRSSLRSNRVTPRSARTSKSQYGHGFFQKIFSLEREASPSVYITDAHTDRFICPCLLTVGTKRPSARDAFQNSEGAPSSGRGRRHRNPYMGRGLRYRCERPRRRARLARCRGERPVAAKRNHERKFPVR